MMFTHRLSLFYDATAVCLVDATTTIHWIGRRRISSEPGHCYCVETRRWKADDIRRTRPR